MATTTFTKKALGVETVEPALTPPSAKAPPLPKKLKPSGAKSKKRDIPEGLWTKCPKCGTMVYDKELDEHLKVCPKCNHHFPISSRERIHSLVETCTFEEMDADMTSVDVLNFNGVATYKAKLEEYQKSTTLKDAVITGICKIGAHRAALGVMDFDFLGGSMGSVVGEMITLAVERSTKEKLPLIIVSASGGARMHEGTLSLMQMGKVSAALARLDEARVPFISVLTDPTTGGVTASYAMLGDLNIAEPGALIGFAGPRVIEQTIRQKLPKGFQRSEFLLEHGMLDAIVDRREMRAYLTNALNFLAFDKFQKNAVS